MCTISFVICTYNGESRIRQVCKSIIEQKSENVSYEIILVDNNSTDAVVNVFVNATLNIDSQVVTEKKQGLIYARIAGVKSAKYDIICFVDDDNYLSNDWLLNVCSIFKHHEDIGAVGGVGFISTSIDLIPDWLPSVQKGLALGPQCFKSNIINNVSSLYGAGLCIRKKILDVYYLNGYVHLLEGRKSNNLTSGEDSEICEMVKALGYRCVYSPYLRFLHEIPASRLDKDYFLRLYRSFGVAFVNLIPLRFFNQFQSRSELLFNLIGFIKILIYIKMKLIKLQVFFNKERFDLICNYEMCSSALSEISNIEGNGITLKHFMLERYRKFHRFLSTVK